MKNNFLKIAIALIIAISLIFVVVTAIIALSVRVNDILLIKNEGIGFTLLAILALALFGLSFYVLSNLFGNSVKTKNVILSSDTFSAVTLNGKVLRQIIKKCVDSVKGAKLIKAKIFEDDKPGFKLAIKISLAYSNVAEETQKIKFMLEDALKNEFNFTFNAITINVASFKNNFKPNVEGANKHLLDKKKEEECKNNCKIASPTPTQQTVLEETLTTKEMESIERLNNANETVDA